MSDAAPKRKLPSVVVTVLFILVPPLTLFLAWFNRDCLVWFGAFAVPLVAVVVLFFRFTRFQKRGKAITAVVVTALSVFITVQMANSGSVQSFAASAVGSQISSKYPNFLRNPGTGCGSPDGRTTMPGTYILYNIGGEGFSFDHTMLAPPDPSDVSVVVFWGWGTASDGHYQTQGGAYAGKASHSYVTVALIALDTQKCLGSKTFSGPRNAPGQDPASVSVTDRDVTDYLSSFFS